MKQFGDAAKAAAKRQERRENGESVTAAILDREITFDHPGPGQLAYLSMVAASADSDLEAGAGLLNFLVSMMSNEDARYLKKVILDMDSGFDIEDVVEVMEYLLEEWSARPTKPASDSSGSQVPTGRPSTAASRRAGSTRSTSRSTDSSTLSTTS